MNALHMQHTEEGIKGRIQILKSNGSETLCKSVLHGNGVIGTYLPIGLYRAVLIAAIA